MLRLHLYFGLTDDTGLPELRFENLDRSTLTNQLYIRKAHEAINHALIPDSGWRITIGDLSLVKSVQEAQQVIDFCNKSIKGSEPRIDLHSTTHGKLRFNSRVYFPSRSSIPSLIRELRESGYQPEHEDEWRVKMRYRISPELLEKELDKLDRDTPWKNAIKRIK